VAGAIHPLDAMLRPLSFLLIAPQVAFLAAPGWAATQELSASQIEADLEFARGLAAQWGFVDIAEGVLDGLKGKNLTDLQKDRSALVRADLYAQSGRLNRDSAERRKLYDRALDEYKAFLSGRSNSSLREEAEGALVSTAYTYSQYLDQDLEEAVGEEATALRERQVQVLTETVSQTGETVNALEALGSERTTRQTQQMWRLMLQRGQMLAMIAKSLPDGESYYQLAMDALEDLAASAGDGTPGAFYAFDTMGQIYTDQAKWSDAALFYDSVLESTIPFDPAAWEAMKTEFELAPADIALYFSFVQLSVDGSIRAHAEMGDEATAIQRSLYFINTWKKEGVSLDRNGQEALLVAARTLLNSNGFIGGDVVKGQAQWFATEEEMKAAVRSRRDQTDTTNFAITLATEVNETTDFGYLRTRAQKLLAEIAETPGIVVWPQLQMEGLMGEYRSGNYDAAIEKARRLATELLAGDESTRLELMPTLYNVLGNIYNRQERPLEAAMAFREGVAKYAGGDLEKDSASARAYNKLISSLVDPTDANSPLTALVRESETLVTQHSEDGDSVLYSAGEKLERRKEYEQAITKYKEVGLDNDYGELALVKIGYCQVYLKKYDEAITTFEHFLNDIVPDPQYDTESPRRKANRLQSLAIVEFYLPLCYFDKGEFQKAIDILDGYQDRHRTQTSLCNSALSLLMRSHLALGQTKEARSALEVLEALSPDSGVTSKASTTFYIELKGLLEKEKDPAKRTAILREMAERLEVSNASGEPSYPNLWNEADHWLDLGENDKALEAMHKLYAAFKDTTDPDLVDKIQQFVIPRYAELLMSKREVVAASNILTPLIEADIAADGKLKISRNATIVWVKTLTGWLEGGQDGKPIIEVPGTGGTEELFNYASDRLDLFARQRQSYSCEWFELKFLLAYTYYKWGAINSIKGDSVKTQLNAIAVQLGKPNWDDVDDVCDKETDKDLIRRTGGHALRNYYRWLEERAK